MTCSIEGCTKQAKARGWCSMHYERFRQCGDPHVVKQRHRPHGTYRYVRADGYIDVWNPTHPLARKEGKVMEHRMMAWDAGMLDDPMLEVHHLNEIRDDNRLENFEVLSHSEHARRHAAERGTVTNQFGTFPLRGRR